LDKVGYVREYHPGDAEYIAQNMRADDVREVQAASGLDPLSALHRSRELSEILCTVQGRYPAALFGVVPVDDLSGIVWLLGTDELVRNPLRSEFIRQGRDFFDRLHAFRPLLYNCVDERNTVHIRWLKWMGCNFIKRHSTYGVEQRPFLEFVRLKHV
jgi:hypothetical protein